MARVVILGAGISGHTAAMFARLDLPREHEVVVISPKPVWNWVPSNVWVGVGVMQPRQVTFELAPLYKRKGIEFHQAKAVSLHPEGDADDSRPFVALEYTDDARLGQSGRVTYDYLINATGPKLNFGATEGLGPGGNSLSVCTHDHAADAAEHFHEAIARLKRGEKQRFLVGTGHGTCTCQGAAFEYAFNLEHELRRAKVRDRAEIVWISNEFELGDFGMGGMHVKRGGYLTHSKIFTESLFAERGLEWITQAHVQKVDPGRVYYESLDGNDHELEFDMAMLLPPFSGVGLQAYDRAGEAITSDLFAPNGFMKVDADYTAKPYEAWRAADWPRTYQNPTYKNVFAVGIAFAPPHPISKPMKSPRGTPIFPTPPRTGMPSAMMARVVSHSVTGLVKGASDPSHSISMAEMGAACVASAGSAFWTGTAASMTVFPIVPDFERFPETGRDTDATFGEIGLAGNWIKHILHHMFIYKAKGRFGWRFIPE